MGYRKLIKYPNKIFDDIYGLIYFSNAEKRIINSPLFQRLRRIKQLGLAYLVFPGAMHTRFSHSIGTLAIAKKIAETLQLKKENTRNLRMAALLHDIGHFPLSHTIESVYKKEERRVRISELKRKLKSPSGNDTIKSKRDSKPKENIALHEEMSSKIIKETDFDNGITRILTQEGYNPIEIANIITGDHENMVLSQLMHSDIDIDQMDYLIRDSKNAGIRYGTCDVDYLISCMIKKKSVIFFKLKALKAIEHFFMSRYFYFTQILYHKTRSVIENIAARVYRRAMELDLKVKDKPIYKHHNLDELYRSKKLIEFDDSYFDCVLKEIMHVDKNQKIKKYAKALYERKPPKLKSESFKIIDKQKKDVVQFDDEKFIRQEEKNEIRIIEPFDILSNYNEIQRSTDWLKEKGLLYGHREAVRLDIPNTYDPPSCDKFLCQFPDTILQQMVNYEFKIYRKYKIST